DGIGNALGASGEDVEPAIPEAIGALGLRQMKLKLFGSDVADDTQVRARRPERGILREGSESPVIPGIAEDGREGVPLAAHPPEDSGQCRLDHEGALVLRAVIDEHLLIVDDPAMVANGLLLAPGITHELDHPLAATESRMDTASRPVGHDLFQEMARRAPC